jgi:ATP-dependent Clp protease ATP-binding subunit ClpA
MLDQLREVLLEKGITLEYSEEVARTVADGSFSEKYGARNMRRYIQKNIEDKLAEKLISDYTQSCQSVRLEIVNGEISVSCMK